MDQQQQPIIQQPPPPPSQITTESCGNYNTSNSNVVPSSATTTYVTIGILPSTQQSPQQTCLTSMATAATSATTTTFKTPLLPMPTIEDIEGSILPTLTHIPGGILKYHSTSKTQLNLPTMLEPLSNEQLPPAYPTNLLTDTSRSPPTIPISAGPLCGTLKANADLMPASSLVTSQQHSVCNANTALPSASVTTSITSNKNKMHNISSSSNLRNKPSSTTVNINSSGGSKQQKTYTKSTCCACFGSSRPNNSSAKSKKRKHNHQTMWSAIVTNLGICALLLAYTLLGSFIFLTIESEDSLQHQHTLASTKRVGVLGGRGSSGSSSGTVNNNIYTHQSHPTHNLDNSTMPVSSSSASSSSPAMVDGIMPYDSNSNDLIYGDDGLPQYALSPDTYDVRQRTIENIWDITVSLNILYKENWTKLAALEIAKFQEQLIKRLNEEALLQLSHEPDGVSEGNSPATEAVLLHYHHIHHEWNFAKAFLYSLTVLTTIGYGNIAPRTTLGRLITMVYAFFGIPLTLIYLSSTGGILAKVAREVFSKALCCCLCSNCGYCCYDEKRMAEKERRMKRKRQQEELRKQQTSMQEPYYVRSTDLHDSFHQTPEKPLNIPLGQLTDIDSLSASESRGSMHGLSILAPILLCFSMMIIYILFGAVMLYRLENWPILDGIYFCFMSLSTIGFGDMLPILRRDTTTTTWFISIYIMSGMALTAMCFNVIHEEIVNRIKIVVEFKKDSVVDSTANDETGYYVPS